VSRRTGTSYRAESPGKLAQRNEAPGSGDTVNGAVVQRQFTHLIRGDLTGRLPQTAPVIIRRNYRPGPPVDQVPTASGMQPPEAVPRIKGRNQDGYRLSVVSNALAGNRPGDRSEVSRGHSSPTPGVMAGTWRRAELRAGASDHRLKQTGPTGQICLAWRDMNPLCP
jgi:hypothetical protein